MRYNYVLQILYGKYQIMLFNNIILSAFNKLLKNNEGSLLLLQKYAENNFSINVIGLCKVIAKIGADGFFYWDDSNTHTATIIIPFSITTHLIQQNQLEIIKKIQIEGNKQFGLELLQIFSKLNYKHIPLTQGIHGAIIQNSLNNFLKTMQNTLKLIINNANTSISEYLQYETQSVIGYYEIQQFCNDVDELRERTNLLEKHLNQLGNTTI